MCCHGPLEIPGNAPKWDSSITVKLCIERLALATGITQSTSKDEILGLIVFNCHTYFFTKLPMRSKENPLLRDKRVIFIHCGELFMRKLY